MKVWILKTKVGSILCRNVFGYYLWEEDELLFIRDVCFEHTKREIKNAWQWWNKTHNENKVYPVQVRMFEEVKPKLKNRKIQQKPH